MAKIENLFLHFFGVTTFLLMKWFDNILLYTAANIERTLERNLRKKRTKNTSLRTFSKRKPERKLIDHDLNQRTSKGLKTPKR